MLEAVVDRDKDKDKDGVRLMSASAVCSVVAVPTYEGVSVAAVGCSRCLYMKIIRFGMYSCILVMDATAPPPPDKY